MTKPIIAVDIDDVLSRSAEGFAAYSNERWQSDITPEDYTEEWALAWRIPVEDALQRAQEYSRSGVMGTYLHFEALPVLKRLKLRYEIVVVTSRRSFLRSETGVWLKKHFPGIFSAIHFAGIWDSDKGLSHKVNATKTETCREIGANYLIDDQLKHCIGAAGAGITSLLFGDYGWNGAALLPKNVIRVNSWSQVEEYFDGR